MNHPFFEAVISAGITSHLLSRSAGKEGKAYKVTFAIDLYGLIFR
jgi:hypothetical protein